MRHSVAVADVLLSLITNPVTPSTLNKPTASLRCCAVSFTWLENGNTMNQRLNVQRPSVLTGCFDWALDSLCRGTKRPHTHTHTHTRPSHQKHNCWCSKRMLTAYETISYGNEYCRSFLVSFSAGEEQSVRCVSAPSLLCTVVKVLPVSWLGVKFYFGGGSSKLPQCSVKIFSCTFAFSTHVWFSTLFFPCT